MFIDELSQSALERPERNVISSTDRRGKDIPPSDNSGSTDLVGSQSPEERTCRIPTRLRPFAYSPKLIYIGNFQTLDQMRMRRTSGTGRIERPVNTDVRCRFNRIVETTPYSGTELGKRLDEIRYPRPLSIGYGQSDGKIDTDYELGAFRSQEKPRKKGMHISSRFRSVHKVT
jgi:hypothetical protein